MILRHIAALALLLASSSANALSRPPVEYRSGPLPPVEIVILEPLNALDICGSLACMEMRGKTCIIYITEVMSKNADFMEHELAHCRGWRH